MHEFPQSSKSIEHILCRESIVVLEQLAARHARPFALQIWLAEVHAPQYSDRWQVFLPHLPIGWPCCGEDRAHAGAGASVQAEQW